MNDAELIDVATQMLQEWEKLNSEVQQREEKMLQEAEKVVQETSFETSFERERSRSRERGW